MFDCDYFRFKFSKISSNGPKFHYSDCMPLLNHLFIEKLIDSKIIYQNTQSDAIYTYTIVTLRNLISSVSFS